MAKLMYIDNFPITKVVNSPRLQLIYRQLNYDNYTYQTLDNYIEGKYHEAIKKIREILKECTMDLQEHSAGAKTAVSFLKFLKHRSASAPRNPLGKAIKSAWGKWILPNMIAKALLYADGEFHDYIRHKMVPNIDGGEHGYTNTESSYKSFKDRKQQSTGLDNLDALDGFVSSNVDAERLFSWGRLSKNYLQGQMSPASHSRNVFLNECQHLL